MNTRIIILTLALVALLFSCKKELSPDMQKVADCETAYKNSPSKETAAAFVAASMLYKAAHPKDQASIDLLVRAMEYTKQQGQDVVSAGITNELIKHYPEDQRAQAWLVDLIGGMEKIGKKDAASTLRYFAAKANPDFAKKINYTPAAGMAENPKDFLKSKAENIFKNVDQAGINRNASYAYVDACEAYVLANPKDAEASSFLFYAGEIAKTVGSFSKTLKIYDWILDKYPNSTEAPKAQFLKAFILEENIKNTEAAKKNYELFIEKFPNHHFADDARFSLKNLGKTSEEIQAELKALQDQNKAQ